LPVLALPIPASASEAGGGHLAASFKPNLKKMAVAFGYRLNSSRERKETLFCGSHLYSFLFVLFSFIFSLLSFLFYFLSFIFFFSLACSAGKGAPT
jgi:hypothetical protein